MHDFCIRFIFHRKVFQMENHSKYNQIIDAFQELLENENIQHISVNDIAKKAGIGKGSIYYYFPSKDSILNALIQRVYANTLALAKELETQKELPPSLRLARIFNSSNNASREFIKKSAISRHKQTGTERLTDSAYIHQQFVTHIIAQLKPSFTEIIKQGIENGDIRFDYPSELADIILIVLTVKIDNTLSPSSDEEITKTLQALITLLEKGTENPQGAFGLKI